MAKIEHSESDSLNNSLRGKVFTQLQNDILNGRYEPGYNLIETRLSEDMGVSRTPIREALRQLELEGLVQAIYVVDTAGLVDTITIRVVQSDDPRFTASVRTALGQMRFRPAKRAGKTVRQLVEQKFRFKMVPPEELAKQIS